MGDGDNKEAARQLVECSQKEKKGKKRDNLGGYLLELSAIPASALYQAKNAARIPKAPPALMQPSLGAPLPFWR